MTLSTEEQSYIASAAATRKWVTSEDIDLFVKNTKRLSDIVKSVKGKAENCHTEGMIDASHEAESLIGIIGNEAIRIILFGDKNVTGKLAKPYNDTKKEYYEAKNKFDTECYCVTRLATQEMMKEKRDLEAQKTREEWWKY